MKYGLIIILVLAFSVPGFSQQRVSFDVNYRQNSFNVALGYHKVVFTNWLVSGTINYGKKGSFFSEEHLSLNDEATQSQSIRSPWSAVDESFESEFGTHYLKTYNVTNKVVTAQVGLGYFYNFDIVHGLRTYLFAQYGYAMSQIVGYYNPINERYREVEYRENHSIAALSLEAYHTVRVYEKFTFYYGFKAPYYFLMDKERYHPTYSRYHFFGFMPELSLGLTYSIGDC